MLVRDSLELLESVENRIFVFELVCAHYEALVGGPRSLRVCFELPIANPAAVLRPEVAYEKLVPSPEELGMASRSVVVGLIRELRPTVIVTHWREGRHPDHRIAAQLAYDASFLSALKNYDAPGDAHRPDKVVHCLLFREDAPAPSFVVDITDHIETKMAALACFESAFCGCR